MALKLMYITNRCDVALIAEKYGVDRIWIDLETLGKDKRQKNIDSVKSHHSVDDVKNISKVITKSEVMVRINPWNSHSHEEIESVINAGADIIMLPMWKSEEEVKAFIESVDKRAKVSLLLETKEAERCLDSVLNLSGIDEIHIGLNDLHLSYGLKFLFELLTNGTVENICKKIAALGIPYGFGGIARLGEGMLPAEYVIAEHYRLGSTRAILSRSFCNVDKIDSIGEIESVFAKNMEDLRCYEETLCEKDQLFYQNNRKKIEKIVKSIVGE